MHTLTGIQIFILSPAWQLFQSGRSPLETLKPNQFSETLETVGLQLSAENNNKEITSSLSYFYSDYLPSSSTGLDLDCKPIIPFSVHRENTEKMFFCYKFCWIFLFVHTKNLPIVFL